MKFSEEFMKPFNGRVRKGFTEMQDKGFSTKKGSSTLLSPSDQRVYYVYICYVDSEPKYIGMGKGKRYLHCVSGKSSCSELNRDFHAGKSLVVEKIEEELTQQEASALEVELIFEYSDYNLYNKQVYPSLASQPMISKINGIKIKEKQEPKELFKQIAKVSPNITEHNFENLNYWLHECGLTLYIAEVGKTKTLVLDKKYSKAFDYLHAGCSNFPCCDINGCGS